MQTEGTPKAYRSHSSDAVLKLSVFLPPREKVIFLQRQISRHQTQYRVCPVRLLCASYAPLMRLQCAFCPSPTYLLHFSYLSWGDVWERCGYVLEKSKMQAEGTPKACRSHSKGTHLGRGAVRKAMVSIKRPSLPARAMANSAKVRCSMWMMLYTSPMLSMKWASLSVMKLNRLR